MSGPAAKVREAGPREARPREAGAPLGILPPGVHPLAAVPGLAPEDAARLGRLGVHTTADLCACDIAALHLASGLGVGHLQRSRDTAELMALDGVGPAFAATLVHAGLASVRILARLTAGDVERFLRRALRHSGADDDGLGLPGSLAEQCQRLVAAARLADLRSAPPPGP